MLAITDSSGASCPLRGPSAAPHPTSTRRLNLSAHSAPPVTEWLAHPKRRRWHLHYTPTSASWLNLVEGWFAHLTNKRLKQGSFDSVAALTEAIDVWASHWNDDPKPFVWRTPANKIITKVRRGRAALTHQIKSATDH